MQATSRTTASISKREAIATPIANFLIEMQNSSTDPTRFCCRPVVCGNRIAFCEKAKKRRGRISKSVAISFSRSSLVSRLLLSFVTRHSILETGAIFHPSDLTDCSCCHYQGRFWVQFAVLHLVRACIFSWSLVSLLKRQVLQGERGLILFSLSADCNS